MTKIAIAIFICAAIITLPSLAMAESNPGPVNKLGRGIANMATGWYEIIREMISVTTNQGDVAGLFLAPFTGTWKAIVRTAAGAYETVTFLIPYPPDYEPIVQPEYVFTAD
jgi:putative exosortase-associated protein (TIGR04073 family)